MSPEELPGWPGVGAAALAVAACQVKVWPPNRSVKASSLARRRPPAQQLLGEPGRVVQRKRAADLPEVHVMASPAAVAARMIHSVHRNPRAAGGRVMV